MRISDWSSDVCSSDLGSSRFVRLLWPYPQAVASHGLAGFGGGNAYPDAFFIAVFGGAGECGRVCIGIPCDQRVAGVEWRYPISAAPALCLGGQAAALFDPRPADIYRADAQIGRESCRESVCRSDEVRGVA